MVSSATPVISTMHTSPAAGGVILRGCDNGTSVAIECKQTRPDDRGCDNEGVVVAVSSTP